MSSSASRLSASLLALAALSTGAPGTSAQTTVPDHPPATVPAEAQRDAKTYVLQTLGRHGPSHFPRVQHPEVQYVAGETLTFDRFHTVDVINTWLQRWAERYPNLVELYEVGTSLEGRSIMQVTLTNKATGPATDKPAAYFEGGRHSGEVTATESAFWLVQHLVEGYGKDAEVTRLLDRAAIYVRPSNNPDGANMYMHTAQSNRSSVRPMDNDGDGLMDEDPANDLDGDGVIRRMRWRDPKGEWIIDPRDPSGRLMRRAGSGEKGEWSVQGEGIDDDGDGRSDEDGVGGLDLHRNYPENWRPMPGREATGRGWTQGGAGAYPLSEPETRWVVLFALEHPNIGVANSMDTAVPMHLRGPSTSMPEERMYPEDRALYEHFDSVGKAITGYPWAGDVYFTYSNRRVQEGEEPRGNPLFGHGPDFGYFYLGAVWYGDELWNGGRVGDLNGDGEEDELDQLIWADSLTAGRDYTPPFAPWKPFRHPVYGDVEIGGWHPKFFSQNAPPEVLEKWAANQGRFNLYLANSLPELRAGKPQVRRVSADADSTTWEVRIEVRNDGRLPTALKQADLVKIVRPDRVRLSLGALKTTDEGRQLRWLEGTRNGEVELGFVQPKESKEAVIRFRTYGVEKWSGKFEVLSTRGGVVRGEVSGGE